MPDFGKMKAEYIRGGTSYRKLAEKYGVSFSSIQKRATREKWTELRRQSGVKKDTKIVESVASHEAKRVDEFGEVADLLLSMIKQGILDGSIAVTGRGYRDVTGALKDLRELKGLKSELDMQEQLARIQKLRKEAEPEQQENKDIKVVISGDLEEYAQ